MKIPKNGFTKTILSEVIFASTFFLDGRKHIEKVFGTSSSSGESSDSSAPSSPSEASKEVKFQLSDETDEDASSNDESSTETNAQNKTPRKESQSAPLERKATKLANDVTESPTKLRLFEAPQAKAVPPLLSQSQKGSPKRSSFHAKNKSGDDFPTLQSQSMNSMNAKKRKSKHEIVF